jgi:hypothetical protein
MRRKQKRLARRPRSAKFGACPNEYPMGGLAMRQLPLAFAVLFLCALAGHAQERQTRPAEVAKGHPFTDFKENAALAKTRYANKLGETFGILKAVEEGPGGQFVIVIDNFPATLELTRCLVPESEAVAKLKAGVDRVKIQGVVDRFVRGDGAFRDTLYMSGGEVVEVWRLKKGGGLMKVWAKSQN